MKRIGKIKRMATLGLIFLLSINSFAAIVSDNDGSAFVTKAEFDALKDSFNSQIQSYNDSIDGKIDGAIAAYLAGIALSNTVEGDNYIKKMNAKRKVTFWSNSTNTFNISTSGNIYRRYLWKYFGAFYNSNAMEQRTTGTTRNYWINDGTPGYKGLHANANWIDGSFLYDIFSYNHERSFQFQTLGSATNYLYNVAEVSYGGANYIVLETPNSYTVTNIAGGYFVHGDLKALPWKNVFEPITAITYNHRDEVLPYTTNSFEPTNIDIDIGIPSCTSLPGATFNVWQKSDNTKDSAFVYDFNNYTYPEDKTLLTFTSNNFLNWTKDYTYTGTKRVAADYWMYMRAGSNHGGTQYYRSYTWKDMSQTDSTNMTKTNVDNTHGSMKVKQPDFKDYMTAKIINGPASEQIGKAVYPYNGVPLTSTPKKVLTLNAILDVKTYDASEVLKSGVGYDVVLSKVPFTNISTDTIIAAGNTDKVKIFSNVAGNNTQNITLDSTFLQGTAEGTVLYIRIQPKTNKEDYHICVDCSKVSFTVEA